MTFFFLQFNIPAWTHHFPFPSNRFFSSCIFAVSFLKGHHGKERKENKDSCDFSTLLTKNVPHIMENIFFSMDYESYQMCLEISIVWKELLKVIPN